MASTLRYREIDMEQSSRHNARREHFGVVEEVLPGSPAEKAGVRPGDKLISINESGLRDVIDYYHAISSANLLEVLLERAGRKIALEIIPIGGSPVGVSFSDPVFDGVRECNNSCVFCFVDQLPTGLRGALYLKDDDYRLSFLWGNFITLTNLSRKDLERIVYQHISPLYVSLHATDESTRRILFGRGGTTRALRFLDELLTNGIDVHLQVVIVPGINDGGVLEQTLEDIGERFHRASSVALVPMGITTNGLRSLGGGMLFQAANADEAAEISDEWRNHFDKSGGPTLMLSDEIYYRLAREVPHSDYYGNYPQLQNGVGMVRKFVEEVQSVPSSGVSADPDVLLLTTEMGQWALSHLDVYPSISSRTARVENSLFGPTVNVCGLMTGSDLLDTIARSDSSKRFLLPDTCLQGGHFIDGTSLEELKRVTRARIEVIPCRGDALVGALLAK